MEDNNCKDPRCYLDEDGIDSGLTEKEDHNIIYDFKDDNINKKDLGLAGKDRRIGAILDNDNKMNSRQDYIPDDNKMNSSYNIMYDRIPNCIHSLRVNLLAEVLRSCGTDTTKNILKLIKAAAKLLDTDCILYRPRNQKNKIKFCSDPNDIMQKEDILTNDHCIFEFENLTPIYANLKKSNKCFYYDREQYTNNTNTNNNSTTNSNQRVESLNKRLDELGIKFIIICLLGEEIQDGVICSFSRKSINYDITQADFDTLSFIASIIYIEDLNAYYRQQLEYRVAFENLLTTLATEFSVSSNAQMGKSINSAIKQLGMFLRIDRSYLFRNASENNKFHKEFVWAAPNIKKWENDILTETQYDWMLNNLKKYEVISIVNVEASDMPKAMKSFLIKRKVKTILIIPIICNDTNEQLVEGFFGFSCEHIGNKWDKEIKQQMKIIGFMLGNALRRLDLAKNEEEFNKVVNTKIDEWQQQRKSSSIEMKKQQLQLTKSLLMLQNISAHKQSSLGVTNG